ncbi:MAG TPA: DUF4097 family beta strand repeat-containing protein [Candidatus Eisenbacteria bacterium]|jgi:hypothetical protein
MRLLPPLALGLVLIATPALALSKVWNEGWDVAAHPDVHIAANDGHVRIHAGPAGHVQAHIEFERRRWGMVIGVSEPTVVFEHKGDQIWITAKSPRCIGVIGGINEHLTVDVTVPQQSVLSVRNGDGAVDCEPLEGRFTFVTGDGAVRAHGLRGDCEVSTGDGAVILDDMQGRLRARTGDGHVTASGRFDALDLSTGDGRVEATARVGSKLAQGWSLETGDGSVTLRVPHDIAALLDARTRDGHINVQIPIAVAGRLSGHELVGELNGGGPPLRVRTGDGSITLALSD